MSAPLSDRVRAYLDQHGTLNLATTGPAGLWSAAVLYVHDGGGLCFTTMATSRHGQNLVATGAGVPAPSTTSAPRGRRSRACSSRAQSRRSPTSTS